MRFTFAASSGTEAFSATHCAAIATAIELVCSGMTDRLLVPLEQGPYSFQFVAVERTAKTVNVVRFEVKFHTAMIYGCMSSVVHVPDCVLCEFPHFVFQSVAVSTQDITTLLWDVMDRNIHNTFDTLTQRFTQTGLHMKIPHTPLPASAAERVELSLRVMCSDTAPRTMLIPLSNERAEWNPTTAVPYVFLTRTEKTTSPYGFDCTQKCVTADLVTVGDETGYYLRPGHRELSRKQPIEFDRNELYREFPGFNFTPDPSRSRHVMPKTFFGPVAAHYTDTIRELDQKLRVDRRTAIAMAFHSRLGASALIAEIGGDHMDQIVTLC
jgi:hypothetical protein